MNFHMVRYVLEMVVGNIKATQILFGQMPKPSTGARNWPQNLENGIQELEVGPTL